jgi:hypothetical protein
MLRYALFFADMDAALGDITLMMETSRRHIWGKTPVPTFLRRRLCIQSF